MTAKRAKTVRRSSSDTAKSTTPAKPAAVRQTGGKAVAKKAPTKKATVKKAPTRTIVKKAAAKKAGASKPVVATRPARAKSPAPKAASPARVRSSASASRGVPGTSSKAAAAKGRKKAAALVAAPPSVVSVVESALDEMKAVNVKLLNVHKLTDITDTMIIASGNSDRHVRSIADRVVEHAKKAGFRPTGVEGERDGEWVLVDLQDVIVHIMLPRVREFYRLESLWDVSAARREAAERSA